MNASTVSQRERNRIYELAHSVEFTVEGENVYIGGRRLPFPSIIRRKDGRALCQVAWSTVERVAKSDAKTFNL